MTDGQVFVSFGRPSLTEQQAKQLIAMKEAMDKKAKKAAFGGLCSFLLGDASKEEKQAKTLETFTNVKKIEEQKGGE